MGHGAMPLEVGGALRSRLEAEGRFEILDCRLRMWDVRRHRAWSMEHGERSQKSEGRRSLGTKN